MSKRSLTHPRFVGTANMPNFWPSKMAIQQAVMSGTSMGTQVQTWATVSGLGLIDCRVAPMTLQAPTGVNEPRLEMMSYLTTTHQIALRGYYPEIRETMRAFVDDEAWDIKGVEHDAGGTLTRLRVNRVDL